MNAEKMEEKDRRHCSERGAADIGPRNNTALRQRIGQIVVADRRQEDEQNNARGGSRGIRLQPDRERGGSRKEKNRENADQHRHGQ